MFPDVEPALEDGLSPPEQDPASHPFPSSIPTAAALPGPDAVAAARNLEKLVTVLKLAYSGELAAAHAYRGHWKSARDPEERRKIKAIEEEELQHRAWVGAMLTELGEQPSPAQEAKMGAIGKTIGFLCRISGWLIPMYGAGRLESNNIKEYEDAARYASACGWGSFVPNLIHMAEVEWDHEFYFRAKVLSHVLGRRLPLWTLPPPREDIRKNIGNNPS